MSLSKTVLFIIDGTSILNLFLFCRVTYVCQRMSSRVHSCIVPDAIVSRPRCDRFSSRVRRQVLVAVVVVRLSKVGLFFYNVNEKAWQTRGLSGFSTKS